MRIAILGNSGSGKSTLAAWLAKRNHTPVLDLDTIAWEPNNPTTLRSPQEATAEIHMFCSTHASWIVEGCYANLIEESLPFFPRLILLDPGEAACIFNCLSRPWERHKYASKAAQDERLSFLLRWVREYYFRPGALSHAGHTATYARYSGPKHLLMRTPVLDPPDPEVIAWTD